MDRIILNLGYIMSSYSFLMKYFTSSEDGQNSYEVTSALLSKYKIFFNYTYH